jgi:hypothetical protein
MHLGEKSWSWFTEEALKRSHSLNAEEGEVENPDSDTRTLDPSATGLRSNTGLGRLRAAIGFLPHGFRTTRG